MGQGGSRQGCQCLPLPNTCARWHPGPECGVAAGGIRGGAGAVQCHLEGRHRASPDLLKHQGAGAGKAGGKSASSFTAHGAALGSLGSGLRWRAPASPLGVCPCPSFGVVRMSPSSRISTCRQALPQGFFNDTKILLEPILNRHGVQVRGMRRWSWCWPGAVRAPDWAAPEHCFPRLSQPIPPPFPFCSTP